MDEQQPLFEKDFERIALLNFGGIGDEILFSPVIDAIHQACPQAHLTLVLEARSGRIRELMPQLDSTLEVELHRYSKPALFGKLLKFLRRNHFDAVVSSGSSPFIPFLLAMSGIPIRVGFDTGALSRVLLTAAAPLDRKAYAGDMYFSLAKTFLRHTRPDFTFKEPAVPALHADDLTRQKARHILAEYEATPPGQRIMIHPGVSKMSVQKNILKSWPLSSWQALMEQLPRRYPQAHVYLLGGPDDAETITEMETFRLSLPPEIRSRIINLYGKTASLRDLAGLIALADVLVSVDSAPMHLAVGLKTPVVAIFSPTDEKKLVPQTNLVRVAARDDLVCRPCLWDVRKVSCETPLCLDVSVSDVARNISDLLAQKAPSAISP